MVRGAGGFFPQTPDKGILFEIFSGRILSRLAGGNSEKEPIEVLYVDKIFIGREKRLGNAPA